MLKVQLAQRPARSLLRGGAFDFVFSVHTWQYVPHKAEFLSEVHRMLKPGGRALIHALRPHVQSNFVIRNKRGEEVDLFPILDKHPEVNVFQDEQRSPVIEINKNRRSLGLKLRFNFKESELLYSLLDHTTFVSVYSQHKLRIF